MEKRYYILMADIIGSSKMDAMPLMEGFKKMIAAINKEHSQKFLSPLTITLGDEFQGVLVSLESAISIIIQIEEKIIHSNQNFKLRYVLLHGEIATPINSRIAHGMLGEGLTEARYWLDSLKKEKRRRFFIQLENSLKTARLLNLLFFNYQSIVDNWRIKDYLLISAFLQYEDYKKVAQIVHKDPSSTFRRRDSLEILEYIACRASLYLLTAEDDFQLKDSQKELLAMR